MPTTTHPDPTQCQLLETLTKKVRILSLEQIAQTHFASAPNPIQSANKLVQSLKKQNLVDTQTSVLHPLLSLTGPIFSWTPGNPEPHFARISWQLRSRWKLLPKATVFCRATKKARELTGGSVGGRRARSTEVRHDLHVAQLFYHLLQKSPSLAATWVHEDTLLHQGLNHNAGLPIPDAIVGAGQVVEFGGSYKSDKLRCIHSSFSDVPYTIW